MIFYIIDPITQPELLFACCTVNDMTENSVNIIDHREGVIEIGYIKNADITVESDGEATFRPSGAIMLLMPDRKYIIRPTVHSENVSIVSLAVRIDRMKCRRYDLDDISDIAAVINENPTSLIMPEMISATVGLLEDNDTIRTLQMNIQYIINLSKDKGAMGRYSCIARWYELCVSIDYSFRKRMTELSAADSKKQAKSISTGYYYVYKANKYIASHLCEPISSQALSEYVGLTCAYFLRLFQRETGVTLKEYVYKRRIQNLCELLVTSRGESCQRLAAECGFGDYRHAQRLFAKYTGMSMSEYRKINHGLTLCHTNPWDYQNLEEDILKNDKL